MNHNVSDQLITRFLVDPREDRKEPQSAKVEGMRLSLCSFIKAKEDGSDYNVNPFSLQKEGKIAGLNTTLNNAVRGEMSIDSFF